MSGFCYDSGVDGILQGDIRLKVDPIYVMLVDASYVPDQGAHIHMSDVTGEISGTGYTAGGVQITPTFSKDTSGHANTVTFPTIQLANSAITARRAIYYQRLGTDATVNRVIAQDDFGANVTTANGTFKVNATSFKINTPLQP